MYAKDPFCRPILCRFLKLVFFANGVFVPICCNGTRSNGTMFLNRIDIEMDKDRRAGKTNDIGIAEDQVKRFIEASVWYGPIKDARQMLQECPGLADHDIYTSCITGRAARVREILDEDPGAATRAGGALNWDPLTYLCFSKFLREERERADDFLQSARLLLSAGASAQTGFYNSEHTPEPCLESAIYGAAGVAFHPELTGLLLDHGADPNDDETPYHAPETYDNATLRVLVESGKLTDESLSTMLLRKCDWHDGEGIRYLLEHHADPNRMSGWGYTALHQAIRRDNGLEIIATLLDHGADPLIANRHDGRNGVMMAAWRGRDDVLRLFDQRGFVADLQGLDAILYALALHDQTLLESRMQSEPGLRAQLLEQAGAIAGPFAGNGNTEGLKLLFQQGIPVDVLFTDVDGYWNIGANSTPLHVAAWRARHDTVRTLIELGADVNRRDGRGQTPLELAVRACVDSHWTERRAPDSVAA